MQFGGARGALARAIPPSASWIESVPAIDGWLDRARAGDVLLYAHGEMLPRLGGAAARLRELAERELVILCQRRAGAGLFDYLARRTRRALAPARGPVSTVVAFRLDRDLARLLGLLGDLAAEGQGCPTNAALGAALDMTAARVAALLFRLKAMGVIDVACERPSGWAKNWRRIVTITATGERTRA